MTFRTIGLRAAAAALLLAGIGRGAVTPVAADSGGLIEVAPVPQLFLLYTGDVIGYLDACG